MEKDGAREQSLQRCACEQARACLCVRWERVEKGAVAAAPNARRAAPRRRAAGAACVAGGAREPGPPYLSAREPDACMHSGAGFVSCVYVD